MALTNEEKQELLTTMKAESQGVDELEHRHQSLLIGRTGTAHDSDILCPFVSLFIRKSLPLFTRNHLLVERGHGRDVGILLDGQCRQTDQTGDYDYD